MRHLGPLQAALEGYCRRWLRDRNAISDVLQNAVANAFRDFQLYVEGTNFRAWMFRYVHLEILNWNRKHARTDHEQLPADLSGEEAWDMVLDEPLFKVLIDDPELVLEQCDTALSEAIWELAPTDRAVLLLQTVGEFKYREIAEILHLPIGTVMSSLARSRQRIRKRLVRYGEECGLLKRESS